MATHFITDEANLDAFIAQMPVWERDLYRTYGHLQFVSSFVNRLLVVYQPQGLNADRTHRDPLLLSTIRVTDFCCDPIQGARLHLEDLRTRERMVVGYTPQRLFNYDVYIQVPTYMQLRWDGHHDTSGFLKHSLSFAALIKTKNRADFYSFGNTYCLPPNRFRQLFPEVELTLPLCL